jgi:cytochrome c oxidase subunit 2
MATPEVTSSVTPQPPGWAQRFPRDERLFLWLVLASVVAMTAVTIVWLIAGKQNVPNTMRGTTPEEFSAQVSNLVQRYGTPGGRVFVPPGKDAFLQASRYTWYPNLVLQSGVEYRVWLSSADALHGFALIGQNLNLEVAPRHAMGAKIKLGKPGHYLIVCNEFCGLGHHRMMGYMDVITAQQMQARQQQLANQTSTNAAPPAPAQGAAIGLMVPGNQLAFDKKALTAQAGKVVLSLKNDSPIPHNIAIKGNGVNAKGPIVTGGSRSTVTAELKAGTYTFYCSVPGHEQAGMHGTLTVK